jgi:ABC-type multidrug transport system fused ATPase/permease subunit
MRKRVQAHIERLPISYFDSTQSGQLISRIMNDAEGIRNLVGTGLVQLAGSILTALISVCVLFYLNWRLTLITIIVLAVFGGILAYAFKKLRPIFRERNQINAEVTGRLTESLGGIRIVKAYTAERREELSFARGCASSFPQHRQILDGRFRRHRVLVAGYRSNQRRDDCRRRQCGDGWLDDARRFVYVYFLHQLDGVSDYRTDFHRHANHRRFCRS